MKRIIKASTSSKVQKITLDQAFAEDGEYYDDIHEYAEEYYGMEPEDIKWIYGVWDGFNEDTGIECYDGSCYIAFSGRGIVEPVTKAKMLEYFSN